MRSWSRRALLVGSVGCLLAACTQGAVNFSVIVSGEGNQVAVVQDDLSSADLDERAYVATIHSESGIGQASIIGWGELSPHPIYFRLHLSGLEQFTLRWAEMSVNVSVNSMDRSTFQSYQTPQQSETMITADSPYWMDVTIPQAADDGFLLRAPAAFVAAAPRLWSIAWIDFYR
jgi:hypothetical protein